MDLHYYFLYLERFEEIRCTKNVPLFGPDEAYRAFSSVPSCRQTTVELCPAALSVRTVTSCSKLSDRSSCGIGRGSHPPPGICRVSSRTMKPTDK